MGKPLALIVYPQCHRRGQYRSFPSPATAERGGEGDRAVVVGGGAGPFFFFVVVVMCGRPWWGGGEVVWVEGEGAVEGGGENDVEAVLCVYVCVCG